MTVLPSSKAPYLSMKGESPHCLELVQQCTAMRKTELAEKPAQKTQARMFEYFVEGLLACQSTSMRFMIEIKLASKNSDVQS